MADCTATDASRRVEPLFARARLDRVPLANGDSREAAPAFGWVVWCVVLIVVGAVVARNGLKVFFLSVLIDDPLSSSGLQALGGVALVVLGLAGLGFRLHLRAARV